LGSWRIVTLGLVALAATGCKVAADGQNLQGARLYQSGNYDTAMQNFQKAVATDPTNADGYYNMACTMHRMGSAKNDQNTLNQAETLYNQCLDVDPNHADCYRALAVLLVETGRSDKAFNLLKNWALRSPQVADARVELARLYEEFGDPEAAKTYLTEAVGLDQYNARAWNALGRLREQTGEYSQALANYQRSYNLNRFQPEIQERMAALNRTIATQGGTTQAGDTRTVNVGVPANR
jgi:tetratricopeptide (TPR) repeat protein